MIVAAETLDGFRYSPGGGSLANLSSQDAATPWTSLMVRQPVVGLIDGPFCAGHADLEDADIQTRRFTQDCNPRIATLQHTTHSVTLLCGSGKETIRGLMPRAKLLVAVVVEGDRTASAGCLASAIHWLCDSQVEVIAIPLGCAGYETEVAAALCRARRCNIPVYAASGNVHPDPVLFPASHSAAISVGAIDRRGELLRDSARKPGLDAVAPGHLIPAPVSQNQTRSVSGTSVATIVAAAAHFLAPQYNHKPD